VAPSSKLKVAVVIVAGAIGTLKVAVRLPPTATAAAPFRGTEEVTVGGAAGATGSEALLPPPVSMVTAPPIASALPVIVEPVSIEMETAASIFPWKTDVVPIVAEVPTCQKILAGLAPPARITCLPEVVVRVEAIWKIQTALASPPASRVTSPEDIASDEVDL
jgi:hypothetical protein